MDKASVAAERIERIVDILDRIKAKRPALASRVARALDGVARANPGTVAATFHNHASDNQFGLFMRDFRRWQRNHNERR
jgi:hypothetical protein